MVSELFRLSPRELTKNTTDEVPPTDPAEEAVAYQNLWSTPPENELPSYISTYEEQRTSRTSNIAPGGASGDFSKSAETLLHGNEHPVSQHTPVFVSQPSGLALQDQESTEARMANFGHLFSGPIDFGPMLDHDSLILAGNGNENGHDIFDFSWS